MKASDFEICVQWYQPELECLSVKDSNDSHLQRKALCLLFALNNKAVNLVLNPASAVVKTGFCHVMQTQTQALHDKLMTTLEMAESDLEPAHTSRTAVGGKAEENCKLHKRNTRKSICRVMRSPLQR